MNNTKINNSCARQGRGDENDERLNEWTIERVNEWTGERMNGWGGKDIVLSFGTLKGNEKIFDIVDLP